MIHDSALNETRCVAKHAQMFTLGKRQLYRRIIFSECCLGALGIILSFRRLCLNAGLTGLKRCPLLREIQLILIVARTGNRLSG